MKERKMIPENLRTCKNLTRNEEFSATRNELIEKNLKFAFKEARKYEGRGIPLEDLIQQANLGLVLAADKFKPNNNNKFISFARHWIHAFITNAFKANSLLKESQAHKTNISKIRQVKERLKKEEISTEELAKEIGIPIKSIENAITNSFSSAFSLDAPIQDEDSCSISEIFSTETNETSGIYNPEKNAQNQDLINFVHGTILNSVDNKIKEILHARYIDNMTLQEIGKKFKMTPSGIKILIDRNLSNLKEKFKDEKECWEKN